MSGNIIIPTGDTEEVSAGPESSPSGDRRRLVVFLGAVTIVGGLLVWGSSSDNPVAEGSDVDRPSVSPPTTIVPEPPGRRWSATVMPGMGSFSAIAAGQSQIAAIGGNEFGNGAVWVSADDGHTWTPTRIEGAGGVAFSDAIHAHGVFYVAGNQTGDFDRGVARLFAGPSIETLTEVPLPEADLGTAATRLRLVDGELYLLGNPGQIWESADTSNGRVWVSTDGATWTPTGPAAGGRVYDIVEWNGQVFAVGTRSGAAAVWRVDEGWAPIEAPSPDGRWPVAWRFTAAATLADGSLIVAAMPSGQPAERAYVWRTTDGVTWTRSPNPRPGGIGWMAPYRGGAVTGPINDDYWPGGTAALWWTADGTEWVGVPIDLLDTAGYFPSVRGALVEDERIIVAGSSRGSPTLWTDDPASGVLDLPPFDPHWVDRGVVPEDMWSVWLGDALLVVEDGVGLRWSVAGSGDWVESGGSHRISQSIWADGSFVGLASQAGTVGLLTIDPSGTSTYVPLADGPDHDVWGLVAPAESGVRVWLQRYGPDTGEPGESRQFSVVEGVAAESPTSSLGIMPVAGDGNGGWIGRTEDGQGLVASPDGVDWEPLPISDADAVDATVFENTLVISRWTEAGPEMSSFDLDTFEESALPLPEGVAADGRWWTQRAGDRLVLWYWTMERFWVTEDFETWTPISVSPIDGFPGSQPGLVEGPRLVVMAFAAGELHMFEWMED